VDSHLLKHSHERLCLISAQGASGALLICGFQEDLQEGTYFIFILCKGSVKVISFERRWSLSNFINTRDNVSEGGSSHIQKRFSKLLAFQNAFNNTTVNRLLGLCAQPGQ
jgi:hypothetical protein